MHERPRKKPRELPPLTRREEAAVRLVKEGGTACSTHLVDLGLITKEDDKSTHEALRRIAKRKGIYDPEHWLGELGQIIFNEEWLNKKE